MAGPDDLVAGNGSRLIDESVLVLVGVLWGIRSLQSFTDPDFTDPGSILDRWAVVSVSLALALLPAGLAVLIRLVQRGPRTARILLAIVAVGAVTAAIANLVEDGLGVDAAGNVYFVSILATLVALLAAGCVMLAAPPRWPGVVVLSTVVGILLLESGGGLLVLLAWAAAAAAVRRRRH